MCEEQQVEEVLSKVRGRTIQSITLEEYDDVDAIVIMLDSDLRLLIMDAARACCETRYITTDDNLADYTNTPLLDVRIKEVDSDSAKSDVDYDNEWGVEEIMFLEIITELGPITFATHNDHNGYYGGFDIQMRLEP